MSEVLHHWLSRHIAPIYHMVTFFKEGVMNDLDLVH